MDSHCFECTCDFVGERWAFFIPDEFDRASKIAKEHVAGERSKRPKLLRYLPTRRRCRWARTRSHSNGAGDHVYRNTGIDRYRREYDSGRISECGDGGGDLYLKHTRLLPPMVAGRQNVCDACQWPLRLVKLSRPRNPRPPP